MILYKYLTSERIDVLANQQIRYTQFGALNDPFELTVNIDKITEQANINDLTKKDFRAIIEEGYDKYPVVHSIISKTDFINLALPLEEYLKPYVVENMNNVIELLPSLVKRQFDLQMGAFSLSEKYDHQLMWSHYAQDHKGFAIGFDSEHKYFNQKVSPNDELRHLRKVVYQKNRPKINLMNPEGVELFTVKCFQWEYEAEWRIIRPFSEASAKIYNGSYPIYLFDFPISSVSNIIIGSRMEDTIKERIKSILKSDINYAHIELYQAVLDDETFSIDKVKIQL